MTDDNIQLFSGVSNLSTKTLLQVRLTCGIDFHCERRSSGNGRTKIWGLVLGQHWGVASKQPHYNATSLLSSVPW